MGVLAREDPNNSDIILEEFEKQCSAYSNIRMFSVEFEDTDNLIVIFEILVDGKTYQSKARYSYCWNYYIDKVVTSMIESEGKRMEKVFHQSLIKK